jgi:hypothetical protein
MNSLMYMYFVSTDYYYYYYYYYLISKLVKNIVFSDVTPCRLTKVYHRFRGNWYLILL